MNAAKLPRGGEFLEFHLIKNLNREIFRPILIYVEKGLIPIKIEQIGIHTIRIPLSTKISSIFPQDIIYNPLKLIRYLWCFFRSGYIFKVIKVIKSYNVDLIYSSDSLSKIVGGIAGKWLGIKVIAHCHVDFSGPLFRNVVGKSLKIVDSFFLDVIIAVSEKVKSCFKVGSKRAPQVITIYNGIDANIYDPNKVDDKVLDELNIRGTSIKIGIVGSIEKIKGQIYLFKAIEKLKADGITDILCLVCGIGPEKENFKKFVKEKELTKEVFFLGFREDIPRILKILDIMIITSFHESFSMSTVEAMAMEVPVIATNVGGIPEVVDNGKTGILVPPGNVDALWKAMKYLIQNPEIGINMGKKGRQRVLERFTIEENVRKTEQVFLQMLKGN
jgi:glycosyltransferase involved in cell wall biosynthesis